MKVVVDESVVVKWFNVEEYSDKAVELKNAHVRGIVKVVAPIHLIYEVGNSIWKNRQLNVEDTSNAIVPLLELNLELVSPSHKSIKRTMEIAREMEMTFYDASYVQLAEENKLTLITADEKQLEKSKDIIDIIRIKDFSI
ncbi:MAG: type II toxin-antitoxin system VapC family toxin [Candidatus Asgardarchaeia archaeon]